jgi:hypothetical protein
LIGYDKESSFYIPLYYVYTKVNPIVFHVTNADADPKGNDNRFCGHLKLPCLKIDHAISINRYDNQILPNIVGIITGYKLNTSPTIGNNAKETKI